MLGIGSPHCSLLLHIDRILPILHVARVQSLSIQLQHHQPSTRGLRAFRHDQLTSISIAEASDR